MLPKKPPQNRLHRFSGGVCHPIITSGIDEVTCKSFVEISEQDFETMKKENNEKNEALIKSFKIEIEVYILSKKRF